MLQFLESHALAITLITLYILQAAVVSLPEDNFKFYSWFRHMLRMLANSVPQRYQLPEDQDKLKGDQNAK